MKYLSLVLFLPAIAGAQISNCSGTWTNRECSAANSGTIVEAPSPPDSAAKQLLNRKRSRFHDLNMKSIRARREWGIIFDLTTTQAYCDDLSVSLEACEERIAAAEDRLNKQINDVQLTRAAERANELQEERNRIEQEKAELERRRELLERERLRERPILIIKEPRHPRYYGDGHDHHSQDVHVEQTVVIQQQSTPRHEPRRRGGSIGSITVPSVKDRKSEDER